MRVLFSEALIMVPGGGVMTKRVTSSAGASRTVSRMAPIATTPMANTAAAEAMVARRCRRSHDDVRVAYEPARAIHSSSSFTSRAVCQDPQGSLPDSAR
jgi:hypothetical protein